MMVNQIEQQALDFANVPIIQRDIVASVHLEDWEDVLFWDTMMQRVRPGRYNYLSYSKGEKGQRVSGGSQCLKYIGYTSRSFFVCIDSDLDYLMQVAGRDASHFVAQTYTYSWENHYAMAEALQTRFVQCVPQSASRFDFKSFLLAYSSVVYRPLVSLLHSLRSKDERISRRDFSACLPHQCSSAELADNGRVLLNKMENDLTCLLDRSGSSNGKDFESETKYYASLGLREENAYLHVCGHNLYDLLKSIGRQLCSPHCVDFENDVLNAILPDEHSYWELERVACDLETILV